MEDKKLDLQEKLSEKISTVLKTVIDDRKKYYETHDRPSSNETSLKHIYTNTANINAAVSGGVGLIPGPLGMAAAIPEIGLIINNQIKMIYDIGYAMGKEKLLTKELILAIFASSVGTGSIGLLAMHGSKVLVKRASLGVMQKIISKLAGNILQASLKSMVAKWLPGIGAAAMAMWSRYTTIKLGEYAVSIYSKDISIESTEVEDIVGEEILTISSEIATPYNKTQTEKIKILINLMNKDWNIDKKEFDFLAELINNSDLSITDKSYFIGNLKSDKVYDIDFSGFANSLDEASLLLIDMTALANADGEFHPAEKIYIEEVAGKVGVENFALESLLAV